MNNELVKRILSSIILLPLAFYFILNGSYMSMFFILVCFFVTCYEWHMMTKNKPYKIYGFVLLIFSFFTFYKLSINFVLVFFVILVCIATDIGGYFFGKIFKGPKLTKISPNKTYSGVLGSFLFSIIGGIIMIKSFFISAIISDNLIQISIIILSISLISQLGDLIISYFKRKSKIKNTGKILPGHGGLLDRIDGILFSVPFSYMVFNYLLY